MIGPQANHWKLGLFVLIGALALFFAVVHFGAARFDRRTIPAVTFIDESVQGLDTGAPVKFRGVSIGRVREITFASDRRHVEVRLDIFADVLERLGLFDDARAGVDAPAFLEAGWRVRLTRTGITGITFLEADAFDGPPPALPDFGGERPSNLIPAVPSLLKGLEDGLNEALVQVPGLIRNIDLFVRQMASELGEREVGERLAHLLEAWQELAQVLTERVRAIDSAQLAIALEDAARASRALAELGERLAAEDGQLTGVLSEAAESLAVARSSLEQVQAGLERFEPAETGAALRRAVEGLALLADQGVRTTEELRADWPRIAAALESLTLLLDLLEREPAALLRGRSQPR